MFSEGTLNNVYTIYVRYGVSGTIEFGFVDEATNQHFDSTYKVRAPNRMEALKKAARIARTRG